MRAFVANWTRRSQLIGFCEDVMDQSLAGKEAEKWRAKVWKWFKRGLNFDLFAAQTYS